MPFDYKNCTEEELWEFIASRLKKDGVDTILVGGAVVSIYSVGVYKTGDLDFVLNSFSREQLNRTLSKLGFVQEGRFYKHPECEHLFLEFASPPASIGDDYIPLKDTQKVKINDQIIHIFTPTDSVRDRLTSYMYWDAEECLEQALMIAERHTINLKKVKAYLKQEGKPEVYEEFVKLLGERTKSK